MERRDPKSARSAHFVGIHLSPLMSPFGVAKLITSPARTHRSGANEN
jgi:hypothetical protein